MKSKSSILDDLEGQYCSKNCIDCSASSLATAEFSLTVRYSTIITFRTLCTFDYLQSINHLICNYS